MSFRITITNGPDQVYICKSNHDKTSVKRWRAKKYCPEFLKTSLGKKGKDIKSISVPKSFI